MKASKGRSFQRPDTRRWLPPLLVLLAGCASGHAQLDRALLTHLSDAAPDMSPVEVYTVACPDALELQVTSRPELSGRREIAPDGRIGLGKLGRFRVEGLTLPEIARGLARLAQVPLPWVQVQMAEFNSRQIYVTGQVVGLQRAVAYQGPETLLDVLQRAGGITPGAAPGEVYVVRSHLGEDRQPEVFRVDLKAIVLKHDMRTNLYVQPLDQVIVGETRPCSFEKCLPPWMRPFYESFWGMRRKGDKQAGRQVQKQPKATIGPSGQPLSPNSSED